MLYILRVIELKYTIYGGFYLMFFFFFFMSGRVPSVLLNNYIPHFLVTENERRFKHKFDEGNTRPADFDD
jgi:hypothetical protein